MLRTKRSAVALILAAVAAVAIPAPSQAASEAMAPCQGRTLYQGLIEWRQTVLLTGAYTSAGAIDVQMTCGIVRQGVTVARLSETAPGPVAVVAGIKDVLAGTISFCHEIYTVYTDRTTYSDTCP